MQQKEAANVLKARGLVKHFKGVKAVAGIDITVRRGECLALLGPNGAGKTTTVEMLEGLQKPDAGTIEVFGLKLAHARRAIMQRVGILLQETHLYKRFTVEETLGLFSSFYDDQKLAPSTIIAKMQLSEKAHVQLRHLSGGQKQRVYIGCSLINDPELLFLDEPTTGLDPQARRAIWDLLAALKREGRSILLTTHYMDEAEQLADRVAVIDHGRIIAEGSPRQLILDVCGEQILWLSATTPDGTSIEPPILKQQMQARLPWLASAQVVKEGLELATSIPPQHLQELTVTAEALGLKIGTLQMRTSTLEDVFLKLTGRSIRDA